MTSSASQLPFEARHIQVIAPHSDDAALSCGSTLAMAARLGVRIDIITCFSLSNFVFGKSHSDVAQSSQRRINEDQKFVEMLGSKVRLLPLSFLDAPLRMGRSPSTVCFRGEGDMGDKIVPDDPDDIKTMSELRAAFEIVLQKNALVLAPAAMGSHIDHRLALSAVSEVKFISPGNLWCYEDLPYAAEIDPALRESHFVGDEDGEWSSRRIENRKGISDKQRLLEAYPSQSRTGNIKRILDYGADIGDDFFAERFWNYRLRAVQKASRTKEPRSCQRFLLTQRN